MSVNIHLSLHIEKLSSIDEAGSVGVVMEEVVKEHGIDAWASVSVFHDPPWVKVSSEDGPMIIRGFGEWSTAFERDVAQAVRGVAPAADIDLEWGYPDEG